jgi:hypothetical protein
MPFLPPARKALTPGGKGRFPGFDVLAHTELWDDVTAGIVLSRLDPPTDFSFFTPAEQAAAGALFDMLLAQHDEPKVPVLQLVDERLALDQTDGWRYQDMPEDQEAWRRSLAALDAEAQSRHGARFHELSTEDRGGVVQDVQDADEWHGMPAKHVWSLWTRYACAAFYSHPWAWNEIGFGGPAYPRGYMNLGLDRLEHWEVHEVEATDPVPWANRVEAAHEAHRKAAGDRSRP